MDSNNGTDRWAAGMQGEMELTNRIELTGWMGRASVAAATAVVTILVLGIALGPSFLTVIAPALVAIAFVIIDMALTYAGGKRGAWLVLVIVAGVFLLVAVTGELLYSLIR